MCFSLESIWINISSSRIHPRSVGLFQDAEKNKCKRHAAHWDNHYENIQKSGWSWLRWQSFLNADLLTMTAFEKQFFFTPAKAQPWIKPWVNVKKLTGDSSKHFTGKEKKGQCSLTFTHGWNMHFWMSLFFCTYSQNCMDRAGRAMSDQFCWPSESLCDNSAICHSVHFFKSLTFQITAKVITDWFAPVPALDWEFYLPTFTMQPSAVFNRRCLAFEPSLNKYAGSLKFMCSFQKQTISWLLYIHQILGL